MSCSAHAFRYAGYAALIALGLTVSCSRTDPDGSAHDGGDAGAGGNASRGSGGDAAGGRSQVGDGGDAGKGGDSGSGGRAGCVDETCAGLDEQACTNQGCEARYGKPWLEPGVMRFGGCMTSDRYGGADCGGATDAEVCAHPADDPEACWTFADSRIPDSWILLSNVNPCYEFPQCGERMPE